jgi:thymidylate synthase
MSTKFEHAYTQLVADTLTQPLRATRNAHTHSHFGKVLTFSDLESGELPILSARKYYPKGVIGEFAAFLRGPKAAVDFEAQGCNYWTQWADEDGGLRVDYGNTWIDFNGYNQLEALTRSIKEDPHGRRHLVSGWHPANLSSLSLPCCHYAYQFYVRDGRYLDMLWHQRSVDVMVGLPADALLAALWTIILANSTAYLPGRITMTFGDTHIYASHVAGAQQYLRTYADTPVMWRRGPMYDLDSAASLANFTPKMLSLSMWYQGPKIDFEVIA